MLHPNKKVREMHWLKVLNLFQQYVCVYIQKTRSVDEYEDKTLCEKYHIESKKDLTFEIPHPNQFEVL
jgi:hypothetical protein